MDYRGSKYDTLSHDTGLACLQEIILSKPLVNLFVRIPLHTHTHTILTSSILPATEALSLDVKQA